MDHEHKHIIVVAGETSGDMHAAQLVAELKRLNPSLTFAGLGGPKMKEQGVELYADLTQLAVVGFFEVLKHYAQIRKLFYLIIKKINETNVSAVILVDYPGFNLRLAKKLKQRNVTVLYYVSPQVWAWKEDRINAIKKNTDRLFVLFEFEKTFYENHRMTVEYVGHPLVDAVTITTSKHDVISSVGLSENQLTIGLLPGSRTKEIERILPVMLEAATLLKREHPPVQFLLCKAPGISHPLVENLIARYDVPVSVIEKERYSVINACDVCMVTSGTATLETAMLNKPMVIVYKTSFLTWLLARLLIKIPYIGLVNILAGKKIAPECIQFQATGRIIADELQAIFTNEVKIAEIKSGLKKVKDSLGLPGASHRAAQKILQLI